MSDVYADKMERKAHEGETEQKQTGEQLAQPAGSVVQQKETGKAAPRVTSVFRPNANPNGLPEGLRGGVERLSGLSMHDVRVHYRSPRPAAVNALAYTQGSDIHIGPGQERHLAHEAWHVVQQKQGRVRPTMQAKGVAMNDDWGLEREADVMGLKAWNLVLQDAKYSRLAVNSNDFSERVRKIAATTKNHPEITQRVGAKNGKIEWRKIRGRSGYITIAVDSRNFGHTYIIGESSSGVWMYHFRAEAKGASEKLAKIIAWKGVFEEIMETNGVGKSPEDFVKNRPMLFHELKVRNDKVERVKAICEAYRGEGNFSLAGGSVGASRFAGADNCFTKVYKIIKLAGFEISWSTWLASAFSPRLALTLGGGFYEKKNQWKTSTFSEKSST
ncbi:MAG TPA: DUF4157 domain-containing protein [Chromatiaceae bacterium]|jgi:hypothetical protein|nr:MAG: hypothetical protein N838_07945 [Thiohalocapsa sp. PB-PSB1]QQO52622.1 MAG: DUF4157 domain-containing protein [Thiohalocapsa sp. PB-PSB1]HBG96496.1 DUF4157 domain-containing protein [Chromatiaceae bacterium]HCS90231.1 DUF4157 domain-containing protein [Chromatiaceae bacterium]